MKRRRRCGVERSLARFEPRRATCRDCINAGARAEGRKTYSPENWRRQRYGLDEAAYQRLVAAAGGRCSICSRMAELVIDHDHTTGVVRALLCGPCNRGVGHLAEDSERCRAAAAYLHRFAVG